MADFRVDTEAFNLAISKYRDEIANIENVKKELLNRFNALKKEGWNSTASEKFIKKFEEDWCKDVEKYIKLIEFLIERLESAITTFEGLSEEAKNLQYTD